MSDSQFNRINSGNDIKRGFSSEPALEQNESDREIVSDLFSKYSGFDELKKSLEWCHVDFSHKMWLMMLGSFESSPDEAVRVFNWLLQNEGARLNSESYNSMLSVLGGNGYFKEFWDFKDAMRKKGYGISKAVRDKMLETFKKANMENDVNRLTEVISSGSRRNKARALRLCQRTKVWGDDLERRIKDLNIIWSSDMVKDMLKQFKREPMKALTFFRWIDEKGMFKHNELTYNAMARVLGREDCSDIFWKVVGEMRSSGYEMKAETYTQALQQFCKRKMIADAVMLYEFAMAGVNKPPPKQCGTFLTRKILGHNDLNISLFSMVVQNFISNGNVLWISVIFAVLSSLNSAGRFGGLNRVLEVLEKVGFVSSEELLSIVAFWYTKHGKMDEEGEAYKFMDSIDASGKDQFYQTWASSIEGNLDVAADCFRRIVVKDGASSADYAFHLLITAYCKKKRATDASSFLCDLVVNEKNLVPWHATYKIIISNLLEQRCLKKSLNLLPLMKNHGFPPYIDPIIEYVSKHGTSEHAIVQLLRCYSACLKHFLQPKGTMMLEISILNAQLTSVTMPAFEPVLFRATCGS